MIKFKVFQGAPKAVEKAGVIVAHISQFYWHAMLGNNEIVMQSEGYDVQASAHDTLESVWFEVAKAQAHVYVDQSQCDEKIMYARRVEFNATHPVPYTQDSLRRSNNG